MNINYRKVGEEKHGESIIKYSMVNDQGTKVEILNLGGIITGIYTPDKNGIIENIVVGYRDITDYLDNPSYYGAIIGRTAGRISKGGVVLNGKTIEFNKNYKVTQCHGGNEGFDKKMWNVEKEFSKDEVSLKLYYVSKNGEENYPGNATVMVTYSLNSNNEFIIKYKAISDEDTLINMTNHSYFNLSGNLKDTILEHELLIDSDKFLEIDELSIPTGKILDVNDTPFDFRKSKFIGEDINKQHYQIERANGYDNYFIFNDNKCIKIEHKKTGRAMEVTTDNGGVLVYTMNYPDRRILYNGNNSIERQGVCVETQEKPIGYDNAFIKSSIINKDKIYERITKYKFCVL